MDQYSGKRAIDGVILPRKGPGHVFRDAVNKRDQNPQLCNGLGCNERVNSQKDVQTGCFEKGKSPWPSVCSSSSGKEAIGTSSKAYCSSSNPRKSLTAERKTLYSHLETDSSETSSLQDEPEGLKLIPTPEKIQRGLRAESKNVESRNAIIIGSSVASNVSSSRNLNERNGLQSLDAVAGNSLSLGSRRTDHSTNVGSNKSGLKNFRCNSDAITPGCSSSESNLIRRKDIIKKRNVGGESSSKSRGKKIIDSASEAWNASSRNGISINEVRRSGNTPPKRDNAVTSARSRRTNKGHTRARLSSQGNESSISSNDTTLIISPVSDPDDLNSSALSLHLPSENSTGHPNSFSRPGNSSERIFTIMPTCSGEVFSTHSLVNPDNVRRFNIAGIAEALLAFERLEEEEARAYDQMRVLGTNMFRNSLTLYDRHQDLRLDIDNMTYEELLALEERMGTVSTALTEEILAESLKESNYQSSSSDDVTEGCDHGDNDDIKCSICQEEYMVGDEVGNLQCEHRYHVDCIQQWLRLKNWCPICKAPAALSRSVPVVR